MNASPIEEHTKKPTILIAEGHDILRACLRDLVESHFENCEITEATSGWRAAFQALVHHPDVVLVDLDLVDMDGLKLTRYIKKVVPEIHVIIITNFEHPLYCDAAVVAGADACIVKSKINALVPILTDVLAA